MLSGLNGGFAAGEARGRLAFDIIIGALTEGATSSTRFTNSFHKALSEGSESVTSLLRKRVDDVASKTDDLTGEFRGKPFKADASRINISNQGLDAALRKHGLNSNVSSKKSQFTLTNEELIEVLSNKSVLNSPIKKLPSGDFVREVDLGKKVGNIAIDRGGEATSFITIITDVKGNLVNAFPGKLGFK